MVEDSLYLLLLGSAVSGGLAWGTASLQSDSSLGRLLGYAAAALLLPYVILIRWTWAAACSSS